MRVNWLVLLYAALYYDAVGSETPGSESEERQWTQWSKCSVTCGEGQRRRVRRCQTSENNCEKMRRQTKHCFLQFCPSYLSWPRIHFSGHLVIDVNTVNNNRCAYENQAFSSTKQTQRYYRIVPKESTHRYYEDFASNWNKDGSNQIYFFETYVTSICTSANNCSLSAPIVGTKVIESTRGVMAVMDVDWQKTEIWNFKVKIPGVLEGSLLPCTRHVVGTRLDRSPSNAGYAYKDLSRYRSKLGNVTWFDDYYKELFSHSRELAMTFIIDLFNQVNLKGRISGTIGLTSPDDARQVPSTRVLQSVGKTMGQKLHSAPFFVHYPQRTVTLDFGFSMKANYDGTIPTDDVGDLDLALLLTVEENCRYFQPNENCELKANKSALTWRRITQGGYVTRRMREVDQWYTKFGGVMDVDISHLDVTSLELMENKRIALIDGNGSVYLEEFPHGLSFGFVGISGLRLDPGESAALYGFVSSYGKPVKNAQFNLHIVKNGLANTVCESKTCNRSLAIPEDVIDLPANHHAVLTNRSGLVRLDIKALKDPGNPRGCGLDGQLFPLQIFIRFGKKGKFFTYSDYEITVGGTPRSADFVTHDLPAAVQIYSEVQEKECPNWEDVRHIFIQYYNLYPVMWKTGIIDLRSYRDLRKKSKMLKFALFDVDITDSRYMPMTRDLSKGKKKLIFNWMKCGMRDQAETKPKVDRCFAEAFENDLDELRFLIHKAIMLELSTIPPYVNAWLSLKTEFGRNKEIAAILKSIFNEEMLHMSLDANILNAIGGVVNMTDETKLPIYPTTLASGQLYEVFPDTEIGLAPFSIGLVEDIFSKIEKPSGARGRQIIHKLAEIWKNLPSTEGGDTPSPNIIKLLRDYTSNNQSESNGLTEITSLNATSGLDAIKCNLESWGKLADFAEENLNILKLFTAKTVGEYYTLIALKITSLESCLQMKNLRSKIQNDSNTFQHYTIFTGNKLHQLNMSHWYQQSEDAILHVVESMGGDPTTVATERIERDRQASLVRPTLFEVTDLKTAIEAIVEIAYQGEGSSECSPFVPDTDVYASEKGRDKGGELSHYYRFQEMVHGRKLIKVSDTTDTTKCHNISLSDSCSSANSGDKYCYGGDSITFYEDGVWPILFNPQKEHYIPGSKASLLHEQFNLIYTRLLFCLQTAFGGHPVHIRNCMANMYDLVIVGKQLVQTPLQVRDNTTAIEFGKTGMNGAPTWLFVREKPYRAGEPLRITRERRVVPADSLLPPA